MASRPADFKSDASTSFAIRAMGRRIRSSASFCHSTLPEKPQKPASGYDKAPDTGALSMQLGAGNESCTRALSLCFPINFSAVVSSEGLNSSLVFFPRQQSSSTNFHQRPRTAIPFSRHGRRTRRYQRPTTAAPLAQPGLLASEMATASRVETALGWMPCGPQLKVARGEGHAASEERWGRMFTSPGRLTTESERRTTASN